MQVMKKIKQFTTPNISTPVNIPCDVVANGAIETKGCLRGYYQLPSRPGVEGPSRSEESAGNSPKVHVSREPLFTATL